MSAPDALVKCPKRERRCVFKEESAAVQGWTYADTRSSWQFHHPGNSLPLTLPRMGCAMPGASIGAVESARWRLRPSVGGSQGEWNQSGGLRAGPSSA